MHGHPPPGAAQRVVVGPRRTRPPEDVGAGPQGPPVVSPDAPVAVGHAVGAEGPHGDGVPVGRPETDTPVVVRVQGKGGVEDPPEARRDPKEDEVKAVPVIVGVALVRDYRPVRPDHCPPYPRGRGGERASRV